MDDLQAVRHIPKVLQQISLFTFGNADILHIIVKFKVIILPVPAVHFAEKCLPPILWCQVRGVDHRAAPKRVEVRLFHFQPNLRVRSGHRMGKHTLALCHLYFLFLQKANAGDPCAAHIIKDIGTAQVPLLLANDADRILTAAANALLHIVLDFDMAAIIAITANHAGAVGSAGNLHVLPVLSLTSLRFHPLGALLVGISLTSGVAGVNGSGKSTFAKILNRLLLPIEGTVLIGGLDAMQEENIIPIRKMVGMVFQNPDDQLIGSVVEEDVAFGAENISVPHKELVKRVEDALAQVGLAASMRIEELSGGGKQKVAIAGVLAMKPRYIVLDEATSMLDPKSRRDVLQLMKELQKQGITIILITHLMEELLLADWIYVMHQGRLAMKGSREALFSQPERLREFGLELPMTVLLAHALAERGCVRTKDLFSVEAIAERIYKEHPYAFLKEKTMEPASVDKKAKVLSQAIVFQHVNLSYGKKSILNDVCCSIEKGSYTAIIGPSGAGKSTLLQMIPALISPTDGSIYVDGMEVTDTSADIAALRKKIGFIFQYPEQQLFAKNVYEDVVFGPRNVGISEVEAEKRAYEAIQFVGLPQDVYDLPMDKLSGGQKRRVALAGVIAMQPDYLILDEPLAGLDPVGKKKMLQILRALHRDAGITVVVVSHDADAVVEDAEQVLYLRDGKILEQGAPSDVFYRLWLREMEHMTRDKHSKMNGEQMRDRSTGRLSEDTLAEAICELPGCMQLLIRLRIMGLPVSCKHTQLAETVQAIVDAVGR